MGENTQEKNLIKKEEKTTLLGKIKKLFKNLFAKKELVVDENEEIKEVPNEQLINDYKETIKITKIGEIQLLDIQRRYRKGEIAPNDLTDEQLDAICDLYDKQIEEIKQSIKIKEEKIAEYKRKMEDKNA